MDLMDGWINGWNEFKVLQCVGSRNLFCCFIIHVAIQRDKQRSIVLKYNDKTVIAL